MGPGKEKGFDRNYWALTLEGAAFVGGMPMLSASGVVALFIDTMTGSKALVGLAVTIQALSLLLGQLLCAPYVGSIRNIPGFMFKFMLLRALPILMGATLFLGADGLVAASIFLLLYGAFWLSDGVVTMPWGELSARAIKPELRGHMMGMQITLGGLASLLTGLLLTWLLSTPRLTEQHRFGTIFIIASTILLISLFFIRLVKDPSPVAVPAKLDIRRYYSKIPAIIKASKPLQYALLARMPGYIGFSAITFIVVFGKDSLGLSETQISWLVYAQIVGSCLGGFLLGEVSRRFGNKTVILVSNMGVVVTLSMAIMLVYNPALGYAWLIFACALASLLYSNWLGYFNYFLDIAPREDRPAFQLSGSSIGIPFSFAGYGLGAIIDKWGFVPAFIVGGIAAVFAVLLSTRLLSRKQIKNLDLAL